jgi:hypothetical protein
MKNIPFIPGCVYPRGYNREQALESVGHGYARLIHKIFDKLVEYPNISINTVRSKWGGLRVYSSPIDEDFDRFVINVELESFYVCEDCGRHGNIRIIDEWNYKTLCENHANGLPIIEP